MANDDNCCHSHGKPSSLHQTLDEMDFERGIWTAAYYGDMLRLKYLVEKGNDVNKPDTYGFTALHYAARQGKHDAVKYLLMNNADPNKVTRPGESTPLHRAAYQGHEDIVLTLLNHGALANLRDADGKTALHKAAEMGRTQVCNIFITKYPHLKKEMDNKGMKPCDLASDEPSRLFLRDN